jgi:hypothetical protein
MMKKLIFMMISIALVSIPVFADSFTVLGGYTSPRGDSDIYDQNALETDFDVDDLNDFGASFSYDHFVGDFVNIGGGLSFYQGETRVTDQEFEFSNGDPIRRLISLQIIPLEANIRFLPAGREAAVIPYIGGGAGIYFWEYEERGDFVFDRNSANPSVVTGSAFSDGADPGWHVEGGVHIPFSRQAAFVAEGKYWRAEGDLDERGFDPSFEPIDLSGTMFSAGISIWF